ncbi:MAG: DJ-1/PfpI family protein, partial [Anaerolineales bacterium]
MRLKEKRIAVLVEEGFEDLEFWVTVMRLQEEGARVTVVGLESKKTVRGKVALTATSDAAATDVKPDDFDALVVPGGWAPDKLRRYDAIKKLVRGVYAQGKIVGLICHA